MRHAGQERPHRTGGSQSQQPTGSKRKTRQRLASQAKVLNMKQMKTAAALRASDTSFLQDSMPKLIEEITKPKPSPVQEAAFRATKALRDQGLLIYETGTGQGPVPIETSIIAYEFSFVDELMECLREVADSIELNEHARETARNKARALLERIEKGTK